MEYKITRLQSLKRYPTYQFYSEIHSAQVDADDIFKISILETYKWLRARLFGTGELPTEFDTPEPDHYPGFDLQSLSSFSLNHGWIVDMVFIPEHDIWSFQLHETDMGANPGTAYAREPVQGRTFETEIALRRTDGYVEIGVRTICSEPSDCTAPCEVFRPTVIRSIADNPLLSFKHHGLPIDSTVLMITSRTDAERFVSVFQNPRFNLPIVTVIDSGYEEQKLMEPTVSSSFNLGGSFSATFSANDMKISVSSDISKKSSLVSTKDKTDKPKKKAAPAIVKPIHIKRAEFPFERLAKSTLTFALVVYIDEKILPVLQNKLHLDLHSGDVAVYLHETEQCRYSYRDYAESSETLYQKLKSDLKVSPKRRTYDYGDILFSSEAHILSLQEKRSITASLNEQCDLYQQEITELKKRIQILEQQDTDLQIQAEESRKMQKKLKYLDDELTDTKEKYTALNADYQALKTASERTNLYVNFLRDQYIMAAGFPTHIEEICAWAEKSFPDTIIISSRAKSEMRKYDGGLDTALLCDSLVYLNAYGKYRKGELSESELQMYTENHNWEAQPCGKEAVQMFASDYAVTHDGVKYTLDMHLKYGNRSTNLIRIYFCWSDKLQKVLIGSMPEHLPTVSNTT